MTYVITFQNTVFGVFTLYVAHALRNLWIGYVLHFSYHMLFSQCNGSQLKGSLDYIGLKPCGILRLLFLHCTRLAPWKYIAMLFLHCILLVSCEFCLVESWFYPFLLRFFSCGSYITFSSDRRIFLHNYVETTKRVTSKGSGASRP